MVFRVVGIFAVFSLVSACYTPAPSMADADGSRTIPVAGVFAGRAAPAPVAAPTPPALPPVAAPPPPVPQKIVLRGVNFEFDSDAIRSDDQAVLDAAIEALRADPAVKVKITGFTDSTGPDAHNQMLSKRRAASVGDYLSSKGVDSSRLTVDGMGPSNPVADNATRDGRAQNRRVELSTSR